MSYGNDLTLRNSTMIIKVMGSIELNYLDIIIFVASRLTERSNALAFEKQKVLDLSHH